MPRHPTPHPDLAGYVLGGLEPDGARDFEDHLAECSTCRAEVAELSSLPGLLRRSEAAVEPPEDLRSRTFAAIDAASQRPRARRPSRMQMAMAAAAVVVVLVAAVTAVVVQSDRNDGGDVFTAELTAVIPQSDARGTARLRPTEQGVVVELSVAGLSSAGDGHYECWYVDPSDGTKRVSAGTFVTGEDGTAKVRMTTAADPVRFPRIVVTREPDDGDPAPGEPVLTSTWSD